MEKKVSYRISEISEIRETSRETTKISITIESHKNSFSNSHQCSSSMEKSNEELNHIPTNGTIAEQAIYGPNNNPYPQYFVNEAQYSQALPAAASNPNTYGRANYVDRQNFVGQAYNPFHDRVLSPANNSLNSHGRFAIPVAVNSSNAHYAFHGPGTIRNELGYQIIPPQSHNYGIVGYIDHHGRREPFAPNNFSGHPLHASVMVPVNNSVSTHGHGRFPTPSPFNNCSPYILHGPGSVRNESGYVNNEGPSQIYPAASSGYGYVDNNGRISYTDPQFASFTVNTAQSRNGHILQPAVNSMNSSGGNSEVKFSTDRSAGADTNFLKNQHLKLIHKVILCYKANTTLYEKHTSAFEKKDWLRLAYTRDGLLKADMNCPVCLVGINPLCRASGSWEFTNMKRHFSLVHPDDLKMKPTTDKAARKTRTLEVPEIPYIEDNNKTLMEDKGDMVDNSKAERNETSVDSKVTGAEINKLNKTADVVAEKDSIDLELKSEHESNDDSSCMDLLTNGSTTKSSSSDWSSLDSSLSDSSPSDSSNDKVAMQTEERKKANLGNESRFNITTRKSKCMERNQRDKFNSPASVGGSKRKQRNDSSTSVDSSVDLSYGQRKHMKNVKVSTSTRSKKKGKPKNRVEFSSSESKTDNEDGNDKVAMQTKERKKGNLGKESRTTRKSKFLERSHRDKFNSPASVDGAKRKQRKESSTSVDSSVNVDVSCGQRQRMKNVEGSTSTKTKQKEPKGKTRKRSTGKKEEEPNNREESSSSGSETDNEDVIPEWRKNGVEFSWIKYSQRGSCYPGFIFPELDANGKRSAQYLTLKGELSDIKHPVEYEVNYEELPQKYHQLYAKAFEIFNTKNHTNYH